MTLRPEGAVCEQSVYEDAILRLQGCRRAANSIKHGKSRHSGGGPDQCPSVHHTLLLNHCLFCGAPPQRDATKSLMVQIVPVLSRVPFNS
jgi:hypothetical protein